MKTLIKTSRNRNENLIQFHHMKRQWKYLKFVFALFYFTILYWFCHISTWIRHGCTRVPNPEPPSHLPPCTIPLGHPSAPAPSILYPASNLDWRFISYMILYMFQCHSPKRNTALGQCFSNFNVHTGHSNILFKYRLLFCRSGWA